MTAEIFMGVVIAVAGVVNVWLLFAAQGNKAEIRELRHADKDLGEKMAAIQVLVAGQYVTREEFRDGLNLQTKTILDHMENIAKSYVATPTRNLDGRSSND